MMYKQPHDKAERKKRYFNVFEINEIKDIPVSDKKLLQNIDSILSLFGSPLADKLKVDVYQGPHMEKIDEYTALRPSFRSEPKIRCTTQIVEIDDSTDESRSGVAPERSQGIQTEIEILKNLNEKEVSPQPFAIIKRQLFKSEAMTKLCNHGKDHKKKEELILKYLTSLINARNLEELTSLIKEVPQAVVANTGFRLYSFFHPGDKSTTDTLVKKLIAEFDVIKTEYQSMQQSGSFIS
jgi:hypothetical protein